MIPFFIMCSCSYKIINVNCKAFKAVSVDVQNKKKLQSIKKFEFPSKYYYAFFGSCLATQVFMASYGRGVGQHRAGR